MTLILVGSLPFSINTSQKFFDLFFASIETMTLCDPIFSEIFLIRFGLRTAEVLIEILSAPEFNISNAISKFFMPPPIVTGQKIFL